MADTKPRVGFIGLGLMGIPMAAGLIQPLEKNAGAQVRARA